MAFPQDPNDVDIELYYNGVWNNINFYVFHRDAAPIVITRGRANQGRACDPGKMTLQINNRDGRFSPRNPNSPLFGKIGRNTLIRVSVTYSAVTYVRFVGEIPSWPSRWDVSGKDVWIPIEAAGILRRLGQGSKPIRSPLFRAVSGVTAGDFVPHAYWPMEDAAAATQFASGLPGGSPMVKGNHVFVGATPGTVAFASEATLPGSQPLPVFGMACSMFGPIPPYIDTGQWVYQIMLRMPSELDGQATMGLLDLRTGNANLPYVFLDTYAASATTFEIRTRVYDSTVSVTDTYTVTLNDTDYLDQWVSISVASKLDGSGANDTLTVLVLDTITGATLATTGQQNVDTNFHGPLVFDEILSPTGIYPTGVFSIGGAAWGHAALFIDPAFTVGVDDAFHAVAAGGHLGEQAHEGIQRICDQASLPVTITGSQSALVGPERTGTILGALRDREAVDQGFLFERRDVLGLKYRTSSSRYNQTPIALDYSGGHISAPFDPEPDDQNVANDREVKRRNGGFARRELTSGPLSVQDPPDGVGRYDDSITVDAYTDEQLEHIANWRLHVGTWDAERYPRVRVDLSAPGNNALIPRIAAADSSDLITIDNLPAWLPPETAELLIEGYREVIGFYDWDFTFNCSPAGPYNVVGVWDFVAKELQSALNTTATSADVANTSNTQPLLATSIGSGYSAKINGEEIQITAVAASTVTFGTTGTAAHANNASVTPGIPASVAAGNLLLCLAAIRNSGTGVPDTPSGYTRLAVLPATANVQLFAKIATSGAEVAPTISFTGGAANADTSAQMIRLVGKWHSAANALLASAQCLNASAQDITYPGLSKPDADNCIILYIGWKQDDWTSVAAIAGATEIGEPSTTTGDDQGLAWDYVIQTTATAIAAGAFTVTGGASAISRGAVLALRCDYQTATITRSVNGVVASHAAGDDVTLTRPMRWAL